MLGGVAGWIWMGTSGEKSPGNTSERFPKDILNKMSRSLEGWRRGNLGRGAQATKVNSFLKKL